MTVVMGYHVLPSLRNDWSTEHDLRVPYIANIMNRNRFEEIRSFLHFNENELMLPLSNPYHDRTFKIRPVLDNFNFAFSAAMAPAKCQSIDEHTIKFKSHNIPRQYVKGMPIKWGFKIWYRCDSKTGYLFEFNLYLGKKVNKTEYGLREGVVIHLTQKLENLFFQINIDNFLIHHHYKLHCFTKIYTVLG